MGIKSLILLLVGFYVLNAIAEEKLYRYRNAENTLVIDFSIPPRYTDQGYDIVSLTGILLETVPPKAKGVPDAYTKEKKRHQKREDAFILSSYSTVADVDNARKRRLDMLNNEIDIIRSNMREYQRRRSQIRDKVANYQASGRPTPETLKKALLDLTVQESNSLKLIAERHAQYQVLDKKYSYYGKRLMLLRDGGDAVGQELNEKSRTRGLAIDPSMSTLESE